MFWQAFQELFGVAITAFGFRILTPQGVQARACAAKSAQRQRETGNFDRAVRSQHPGRPWQQHAKDSRCFEMRFYSVDPSRDGVGQFKGGINELHRRFREGEVEVFKKNGVDVMAVWQNLDEPDTLVYLLSYKDRAAREAGWAAFNADPSGRNYAPSTSSR